MIKLSISGVGNSYQKLIGVQSMTSQKSILGSSPGSPTIHETNEDSDDDLVDEVAAREWRQIIRQC